MVKKENEEKELSIESINSIYKKVVSHIDDEGIWIPNENYGVSVEELVLLSDDYIEKLEGLLETQRDTINTLLSTNELKLRTADLRCETLLIINDLKNDFSEQ